MTEYTDKTDTTEFCQFCRCIFLAHLKIKGSEFTFVQCLVIAGWIYDF